MRSFTFLLAVLAFLFCEPVRLVTATGKAQADKFPDIAYRERAFLLFKFIALDKQKEKGLESSSREFQNMNERAVAIWLELIDAGVFLRQGKPLAKDNLERLSPAAKIFYEYYQQALTSNLVLQNLEKPVAERTLYGLYQGYRSRSYPDAERLAYEAAARELDPGTNDRSWLGNRPLLLAASAGSILVGLMAFGGIRLRNRAKRKRPPGQNTPPSRTSTAALSIAASAAKLNTHPTDHFEAFIA